MWSMPDMKSHMLMGCIYFVWIIFNFGRERKNERWTKSCYSKVEFPILATLERIYANMESELVRDCTDMETNSVNGMWKIFLLLLVVVIVWLHIGQCGRI